MKRTLIVAFDYPLRLLAFWLLFFAAFRAGFLIVFYKDWSTPALGVWASLWHALPLDLSAAGYLMALPLLLRPVGLLGSGQMRARIDAAVRYLHFFLIAVLTGILVANLFIYEEWHTLMNNRAIAYLKSPAAMYDSLSIPVMVLIAGMFGLLLWLMIRLQMAIAGRSMFRPEASPWSAAGFPAHLGVLALMIRGGLGVMPVNESAVYYSSHLFENHAATNVPWHLLHSFLETRAGEHHYRFMEAGEADQRVRALLEPENHRDPGILADSSYQPNVVLIVMEGMTAQVVEELAGEPGVCPHLSALIREGVLFERCYGSGYRTDQGLVSILAGYPALPDQSIVLLEDKAVKLPSLPKAMQEHGYHSYFYYGGELTFANIGVWLAHQGFEQIRSGKDFPAEDHRQRWGVDDERLLDNTLQSLHSLDTPFFATILTLSLHSPFDVPYQSDWLGPTRPERFRNSAAFADAAIGKFFESARKYPWYDRTLFVLVADHGNSLPGEVWIDWPRARQVPLIITGPALHPDWRGKRVPVVGGHHDLPATLLNALGYPEDFPWSRSLWPAGNQPPVREHAYYTNEDGLGWVTSEGGGFYHFRKKEWQILEGALDSVSRRDAQAYLQSLYADFLAL